eukprot:TRINITY_DN25500_c0_g1_i7.p1 TRINITY_DN25500_c0_g1~~TRINITY_DN25500_c0_g1_i7.p1  ORF type:complete len:1037 (+),score=389.20 TRINITY_DN25500_c0_g1_i7:68-3178(+)
MSAARAPVESPYMAPDVAFGSFATSQRRRLSYIRHGSVFSKVTTYITKDEDDEDDDGTELKETAEENAEVIRQIATMQKEMEGDEDTHHISLSMQLPVQQASLYVKDALIGSHYEFDHRDSVCIQRYKYYRSERVRFWLRIACVLNILMALVQVNSQDTDGYLVGLLLLPLELMCLSIFAFQSFLQYKFLKRDRFFKSQMCVILLTCTVIYFCDIFILPFFFGHIPIVSAVQDQEELFFLRFYIRPVYAFFYFTLLRETLPNIVKSAKALVPVVLFIVILLMVFSIYGFMLFFQRNSYFETLPWAMYQMLITLTTANFPDVMVQGYSHPRIVTTTNVAPYYNHTTHRWVSSVITEVSDKIAEDSDGWEYFSYYLSPFFFIVFYLVGMYFLLSVAFAVVFDVYKDQLRLQVLAKYSFRLRMLGNAYHCLMTYIHNNAGQKAQLSFPTMESSFGGQAQRYLPNGSRLHGTINGDDLDRPLIGPHTDAATAEENIVNRYRTSHLAQSSQANPRDAHADAQSESQPKGVNLYLFRLLYNELFPPTKKEMATTEDIEVGDAIALVQDTDLGAHVLPLGTTGVVLAVPSTECATYEIDFQGMMYQATLDEIILVEPPGHPRKMVRVLFHALDLNGSGFVDNKQFRNLYELMQLKVKIVRDSRLFVEKMLPSWVFNSCFFQAFLRFGRGKWLDRIIAVHIFASVVLMAVHYTYIADQVSSGNPYLNPTWYHFMYAEIAVGVVFDVETLIKVMCLGWSDYWSKKWNRYDFTMTVLNGFIYVSLGTLGWYTGWDKAMAMVMELQTNTVEKSQSTPDLIMIVLLARLVRVVRIVSEHKQFRYILKTFSNILPIFAAYISVVFIVYFYFVSIGMIFLRDVEIPLTTQYSQSNYYALNFDSFYSSSITLWCIMIVNNWFVIVDGYRAAKGDWVIIYFVLFWLICVILLMNVVTALVVEVWGSQWELNKSKAVNIDNNPLAKRIHSLNNLTPEDGMDYYKLGLPPDPDGSRPRYKVTYRNYSHKVTLALERLFLHQKGFEHVTLSSPCE